MSLLDPIVFEEPIVSDEHREMSEALGSASVIYEQLRNNPGKWAKFGEASFHMVDGRKVSNTI